MISKKEISYKNFGKCMEFSNGVVQVVVTLDFGPRVIRYARLGGENIFFEDIDRKFFQGGTEQDDAFGENSVWYIYGGHRMWTSPEQYPRTYYPDNEPVKVSLTENGGIFTPPVQRHNQFQYAMEISLAENSPEVTVKHHLINHGKEKISLSIWPISVMSPGGVEAVPMPTKDTDMQENRRLSLWTYSDLRDSRLTWLHHYLLLRQDTSATNNFKIGINSQHGCGLYFNHGDLFVKKFEVKETGNYPDGGASYETYTNPLFLEIESLSELTDLSQGESFCHTETWNLLPWEKPVLEDEPLDEILKTLGLFEK